MSKIRRKARRRSTGPILPWLRSARTWMAIAWMGTFTVIAYGLNRLDPYAQRIITGETGVVWVEPPSWLAEENWQYVLPELEERLNLHPETNPYDDRVCPYVAEQLAGSSWIAQVRRVTKQNDGLVKVYADFRKPFALVEQAGVAYLVDAAGVRLPKEWAARSVNRGGWLTIRGVAARVPQRGQRWAGEDVAAGLKLARFLYAAENAGKADFRDEIMAIDVGNFKGRRNPRAGRLQLVTINPQSYIHWGLPPGEEYGIESSAELKLEFLRELYARDGRLPDQGPIDIRAEDVIGLGDPD